MPDPPRTVIADDPHGGDGPERPRAEQLQTCSLRLLEAISIGEPLPTLLTMVAACVEEIIPSAHASILLLDPDGVHVRHGAAPSLPESYVRAIDGREIGPAAGSCGTAMYRREPVIVADIAHDPLWHEYRELALHHGLGACWSTPVLGANGDVLAAFAVYHREPRAPTPEDLHLLDQMAHVVRLAIEQDRREQALRESQALLRMASQVSRLGAWSVEIPALTVTLSPEARAIHEIGPDHVPTVDEVLARFVPEDRPAMRGVVEACARHGTPFDLVCRFVTARGRQLWLRSIGEAVRDAAGTVVRVQGAIQDVTAQRQAEHERQWLSERLNETLENMTDAFCLVDQSWRFIYMNSEGERVLGRRRADLLGRNMWDEFPEGRDTIAWVEYHRALAEGQARHFELFYPPIDRWLEVNAYPCAGGLAIYFRDVTARHRADDSLRESEERFRLLSQATNDAIWDWNLVDDTVWRNDAMETLFGLRREEVAPTISLWANRVHPDDRERVVAGLHRAIESGLGSWSDEYRFARRDGSYAQVRDRGIVIRDEAGAAVRVIGGMTDVTRQFELEAQLRQAQRLEAIGQLTGGIAHDFNNLLTVILGNAEILAHDLADQPEQREIAEIIGSAAQRGAALTRRLLAFASRQPLDPIPVDVTRLVDEMDALLRRTLGEHIEIVLVHSEPDLALVDPVQLESTLLNLCVNARDAMPDGGRLTIETANVTLEEAHAAQQADVQAGSYVLLAVSDTGHGIAPEHLPHVFEPFFTTRPVGRGSGLGLAIVYGFLRQSGGHVAISSDLGRGTTVRLYLPRIVQAQPAPRSSVLADADPDDADTADAELTGGTETILLVEDEAPVRQYAATQLASLGYRVLQAEDGLQALDILRQRPDIDLLLTDVVLPGGLSGPQIVAQAQALRPGMKVLYTSGYTANADLRVGRLDRAALLLQKPYRRAALAQKVRAALT